MLEILLALIAGVLTIAAPCILLPLPIILGGSVGLTSKTRPLFITLGFTLTFAVLGISLNFLVRSLGLDPNTLRTVAVLLLGLFAIFMIWPTPFEKLTGYLSGFITQASQAGRNAGTGNFGGFLMGVILGIIWAPCAGPILGSILTLIAQEADLAKAGLLLLAYSLGAGLPMLVIAYGGQAVTTRIRFIAKYATRLQQVFGVILILLAIAIYFQYDTKIQAYLVEKLPVINSSLETSILNKLDNKNINNPTSADTAKNNALSPLSPGLATPAPEFAGIDNWLNSNPLTMADLKGKVVLIDFWTYSCINCLRTLPYVTSWYEKYKGQGLVVVGVHTPEFAFEKDADNVAKALKQHNITYPVAQDNNYATWNAYNNRYWPAHYLVDQQGNIRYTHFGEGQYLETEQAIQALLGEQNVEATTSIPEVSTGTSYPTSPEMYFGTKRLQNLDPNQEVSLIPTNYILPKLLLPNTFALEGNWQYDAEKVTLVSGTGKVRLYFTGTEANLVAESNKLMTLTATVDKHPSLRVDISNANLYNIFKTNSPGSFILDIDVPTPGLSLFTFTFG